MDEDHESGNAMDGNARRDKSRRKPVAAARLKLDEDADHFGSVVVDHERIAAYIGHGNTPEERFARDLMNTPDRHGKYVTLPVGDIGRIKAQATARHWQKPRKIDGRVVKFRSVAFPRTDSAGRPLWAVAVAYDPAGQPSTAAHTANSPEPSDQDPPTCADSRSGTYDND